MSISPKEISDMDQATKFIVDSLPTVWWGLYDGCVKSGFKPNEALHLLTTYINASYGGSTNG